MVDFIVLLNITIFLYLADIYLYLKEDDLQTFCLQAFMFGKYLTISFALL